MTIAVPFTLDIPCEAGTVLSLGPMGSAAEARYLGRVAGLRAGDQLVDDNGPAFLVLGKHWSSAGRGSIEPAKAVWTVEALRSLQTGEAECEVRRNGYALAWITLSDKGSRGERVDTAGPLIAELAAETLPLALVSGFLLPDDEPAIKSLVMDLTLNQGFDLVITTGGTGVAPRDVAPEALLAVIEKRLPGFERAMTNVSLAKTPHGAISRAVAGTLGTSIVLTLPGSPKAVRECFGAVLPPLRHALEKLQGDPSDCAIQT